MRWPPTWLLWFFAFGCAVTGVSAEVQSRPLDGVELLALAVLFWERAELRAVKLAKS